MADDGSRLLALRGMVEIAKISLPTVVDATLGRLSREVADARLDSMSRAILDQADVRLTVSGAEQVPWSRAYVIMSNHQSLYDIPLIYRTLPPTIRMITKKELFRVPIWGRAMRAAGFVAIDRQDRKSAIASLSEAAQALRAGTHIWIAPEGTRSRTGALGPFKKGGFHLAIEAGTPIIPVTIDGSRHILAPHSLKVRRGVAVHVTIGAPIPPTNDLATLMSSVRAFMERHLGS